MTTSTGRGSITYDSFGTYSATVNGRGYDWNAIRPGGWTTASLKAPANVFADCSGFAASLTNATDYSNFIKELETVRTVRISPDLDALDTWHFSRKLSEEFTNVCLANERNKIEVSDELQEFLDGLNTGGNDHGD